MERQVKIYALGKGGLALFNKAFEEEAQRQVNNMSSEMSFGSRQLFPGTYSNMEAAAYRNANNGNKRKISSTKGVTSFPSNLQPPKKKRKK